MKVNSFAVICLSVLIYSFLWVNTIDSKKRGRKKDTTYEDPHNIFSPNNEGIEPTHGEKDGGEKDRTWEDPHNLFSTTDSKKEPHDIEDSEPTLGGEKVGGEKVKKWEDPNNLFSDDPLTKKHDYSKEESIILPKGDIQKSSNAMIQNGEDERFYRKLIQHILVSSKEPGSNNKVKLTFNVDEHTEEQWRIFLNSNEQWDAHSIHDSFTKCFQTESMSEASLNYLIELLTQSYVSYYIAIINGIGVFILVSYITLFRGGFSTRRIWSILFILLFGISIPWEWMRMYRSALAEKMASMELDYPEECFPERMGVFRSLSSWFGSHLLFKTDKCMKYHEQLLVDPILKVSPIKAVGVALSSFFVEPLLYIAEIGGKSINKFLAEIPIIWQPFVFIGLMIFLLALAVFMHGFKISTLFGSLQVNGSTPVNPSVEDASQRQESLSSSSTSPPLLENIGSQQPTVTAALNYQATGAQDDHSQDDCCISSKQGSTQSIQLIKDNNSSDIQENKKLDFGSLVEGVIHQLENNDKISQENVYAFLCDLKPIVFDKGLSLEVSKYRRISSISGPVVEDERVTEDIDNTYTIVSSDNN